jgi:hypothetical protein
MGKVPIPPPTVIVLDEPDEVLPVPVEVLPVPVEAAVVAALVAELPTLVVLPSLLVNVVDAAALGDVVDWATVLMPPEQAASDSPATQASAVSVVTRYTFMRVFPSSGSIP